MTNLTSSFVHASLGRYEIQERLGAGGMARVYKGWDKNLERTVAIKILHEHLAEDPTFKERFEREAKFVASFNHPNIVQIYDFDAVKVDGQHIYYMVMPHIPGRSLDGILQELAEKEDRLSRKRVLEIMLNLTDALAYAHERGMIHRDVKPSNILFDERGQAILTDFGIARLAQGSNLTQEGITIGTPAYMSPEQATAAAVDSRTDLYALGVILYEMITGQQPFSDEGSLSILLKHLNEPVPSISRFLPVEDPYLDAVIFRAMAKDPGDRYATAQDFAVDLKSAIAGEPVANPPVSTRKFSIVHSATGDGPTSVLRTPLPFVAPGSKRQNSPLGILAVGMGLVAFLLFIGLVSQQMRTADPAGSVQTPTVESMVDAVDSMTGPVFFTSTFSEADPFNDYWPQNETNTVIRRIVPAGYYEFQNLRPGTAVTSIFDVSYTYENASISMEALLEAGNAPASAYGIVFRYLDENNYNVFAVDGSGRFSIWVREAGHWRELRGSTWTVNPAILLAGEVNKLAVDFIDDTLIGYVNSEEVVTVHDDSLSSGNVGIYLATTSRDSATIHISAYSVAEATATAESMTSE